MGNSRVVALVWLAIGVLIGASASSLSQRSTPDRPPPPLRSDTADAPIEENPVQHEGPPAPPRPSASVGTLDAATRDAAGAEDPEGRVAALVAERERLLGRIFRTLDEIDAQAESELSPRARAVLESLEPEELRTLVRTVALSVPGITARQLHDVACDLGRRIARREELERRLRVGEGEAVTLDVAANPMHAEYWELWNRIMGNVLERHLTKEQLEAYRQEATLRAFERSCGIRLRRGRER